MLWILNRCARMCIKIINSKFFYMGIGFQAGRRNIETSKNNCKKTIWLIQKNHDLLFLFIFVAFLIRSTMKKEEECGYFDSSNYFVVLDFFMFLWFLIFWCFKTVSLLVKMKHENSNIFFHHVFQLSSTNGYCSLNERSVIAQFEKN